MMDTLLLILYVILALFWLSVWVYAWRIDPPSPSPDWRSSLVVLILATVFWPVTVQAAYLELLVKSYDRSCPS